mgnify:CR=1 FL=1
MRFEKEVKDIIYRNIQKEDYRDERNDLNEGVYDYGHKKINHSAK